MKNKIFGALLLLALIFCLQACSGGKEKKRKEPKLSLPQISQIF
jgi:hypothetical protein